MRYTALSKGMVCPSCNCTSIYENHIEEMKGIFQNREKTSQYVTLAGTAYLFLIPRPFQFRRDDS